MDRGKQQEEKDAEKERRMKGTAIYSCVSFLSVREREREKKDKETASSNSHVSASSQTPDQETWGRQWMDASKVNSHNLQVKTVTCHTLNTLCTCCLCA